MERAKVNDPRTNKLRTTLTRVGKKPTFFEKAQHTRVFSGFFTEKKKKNEKTHP